MCLPHLISGKNTSYILLSLLQFIWNGVIVVVHGVRVYVWVECMYMHVPQYMGEGKRTSWWSWFSPSTCGLFDPIQPSGKCPYLLRHLRGPLSCLWTQQTRPLLYCHWYLLSSPWRLSSYHSYRPTEASFSDWIILWFVKQPSKQWSRWIFWKIFKKNVRFCFHLF